MTYFKNDFIKWHVAFVLPYTLTFTAGLFRSSNSIAHALHPLFGMLTLVAPLTVYLISKDKKLIRQMIKSNFNLKGSPLMKAAKVSTQVILGYFLFSVVSGFIINNSLYGTPEVYKTLAAIHGLAKVLVPVAMLTHIGARLGLKAQRK